MKTPGVLYYWREALKLRAENALIFGAVTCRDVRAVLAYVDTLEKENRRLQAEFEQEKRKVTWPDRSLFPPGVNENESSWVDRNLFQPDEGDES